MNTKKILFTILFLLCCNLPSGYAAKARPLQVDVVYTWVDDQDPVWQEALARTKSAYGIQATPDSKVKSRFRNRDELKFSMRSVNAYAKFVHHIYIVTFGHTPSWLKEHKKVTVISHKDIFPNKSDLPTFNSQAIEANLHRIPNLLEHFIYFNDDVFLGRALKARDFYSKTGKVKVIYDGGVTPKGDVLPTDIAFVASWKNTNRLLDAEIGIANRPFLAHAPFALKKSQIVQLEKRFPDIFTKVSAHKFRSPEDYVMTCGFIQNYAKSQKGVRKATITNMTIPFYSDVDINRKNLKKLYDARPHTFCIEDISNNDDKAATFQLTQFLQTYFPEKAPWER